LNSFFFSLVPFFLESNIDHQIVYHVVIMCHHVLFICHKVFMHFENIVEENKEDTMNNHKREEVCWIHPLISIVKVLKFCRNKD
jgi:hypothetical protein